MARKKNSTSAHEREGEALSALDNFFNELFKDVDHDDFVKMGCLNEALEAAKQGLSTEEIEALCAAFRLYVARNFARQLLKEQPLTAAGRLKQIRDLQKYKIGLVCKAFASSEPEAIFRDATRQPGLDPKLIHDNLDAFIEWALEVGSPTGVHKDNKVRDDTIALMVSTIFLNTGLRPTRNRASRGAEWSACSIVAQILGEHGIHKSEDLVENAWKTNAKELGPVHAHHRPDLDSRSSLAHRKNMMLFFRLLVGK
jgi:hypothetical protein